MARDHETACDSCQAVSTWAALLPHIALCCSKTVYQSECLLLCWICAGSACNWTSAKERRFAGSSTGPSLRCTSLLDDGVWGEPGKIGSCGPKPSLKPEGEGTGREIKPQNAKFTPRPHALNVKQDRPSTLHCPQNKPSRCASPPFTAGARAHTESRTHERRCATSGTSVNGLLTGSAD